MNPSFWKGKRILVTGHTGFKGSWLSLWLQSMGAKAVGYSLEPPTQPNLFETARVADSMTSCLGDIRDPDHLLQVMNEHKPQIVIHMAAQTIVRKSYEEPVLTYSTNVMGTAHVLEAVRRCDSVQVAVIVTSDKCYENREVVWGYRESDPMGGHDPYSSSKGCAELVTAAYRDSYFSLPEEGARGARRVLIASVRAGNVIGGGDWAADRLIPDTMQAFMAGKPVRLRYPNAIRPWQFVLEPLRGYLILARRLWEGEADMACAWNFGPDSESNKPVSWIVDRMAALWKSPVSWEQEPVPQPSEDTVLQLDSSHAKHFLRWMPLLSLEETLEWVVEWYRQFQPGKDMRAATESQIARYMELTAKTT